MTQHQSQLFVFVFFFFLLLDRARCLQRTEICAHGALTIHQNSPWYSSYYTEKNSKWLSNLFLWTFENSYVITHAQSPRQTYWWQIRTIPKRGAVSMCQKWHYFHFLTTWRREALSQSCYMFAFVTKTSCATGPFTQPQCIWIKWWMLFIKPYLI